MTPEEATVVKWGIVENCVTLLATVAGCHFVSMWFLLLLLNLNTPKFSK